MEEEKGSLQDTIDTLQHKIEQLDRDINSKSENNIRLSGTSQYHGQEYYIDCYPE